MTGSPWIFYFSDLSTHSLQQLVNYSFSAFPTSAPVPVGVSAPLNCFSVFSCQSVQLWQWFTLWLHFSCRSKKLIFQFIQILFKREATFFKRSYLFNFRQRGRESERERNISVWLPLACPLLGMWPTTQTYVLTGNWISNLLVHRLACNPLSHTSQCSLFIFLFVRMENWLPSFLLAGLETGNLHWIFKFGNNHYIYYVLCSYPETWNSPPLTSAFLNIFH